MLTQPLKRTVPIKERKLRMRKCAVKECRKPFPADGLRVVCGIDCAIAHAASKRKAKDRKERQEGLAKLKSRSDHLREAQAVFNKFIRLRDAKEPCISCGNTREKSKYNGGHFLSVGARPELRFNEDNVHKQCEHCNSHLSGNIAMYRPRLLHKIGLLRLEFLEGPHKPVKYTIDEIKAIKAHYSAKVKALKDKE